MSILSKNINIYYIVTLQKYQHCDLYMTNMLHLVSKIFCKITGNHFIHAITPMDSDALFQNLQSHAKKQLGKDTLTNIQVANRNNIR